MADEFEGGEPPPVAPFEGGGFDGGFVPPPPPPIGNEGAPGLAPDDNLSAGGARGTNPGESYREDDGLKLRKWKAREKSGEAAAAAAAPAPESMAQRVSKAELREQLTPTYQRTRPQWAFGLWGSIQALGSEGAAGAGASNTGVAAAQVEVEFQPKFLQKYGVLGVGPSFTFYPSSTLGTTVWGVGGQARYQLRYFREQPIVPVAGYSLEIVNNGSTLTAQGPLFGAWLLLNVADEESAASFFTDYGICRSYLVAEMRLITGDGTQIHFGGSTLYFGVRLEF
jgi:hypothetical protein